MKFKRILSLFIAIVVFALFLLVAYFVLFEPYCSEHHFQDSGSVVRTRAIKLQKNKVRSAEEQEDGFKEDSNICEKEQTSVSSTFLSLIPDFKQISRHSSLNKQTNKSSSISLFQSSPCRDRVCSEYLSSHDQFSYCSCLESALKKKAIHSPSKCRFMDGTDRDPVALVSFPGSGNTWVRGLLESTTGICTGAVYCDVSLRTRGFTGEHVTKGSVLVVKTHESNPTWIDSEINHDLHNSQRQFGSAIFIIRNPLNALVAEWNRKVANNFTIRTINFNSHTASASKEWFGENKLWQDYVINQSKRWRAMVRNWLIKNPRHPVLVVKYESLQRDTATQVKRMLDFLGVVYDRSAHVEKVLTERTQTFHRKHGIEFDHYTPSQRSYVQSILKETVRLIQLNGLSDVMDISDYLLE